MRLKLWLYVILVRPSTWRKTMNWQLSTIDMKCVIRVSQAKLTDTQRYTTGKGSKIPWERDNWIITEELHNNWIENYMKNTLKITLTITRQISQFHWKRRKRKKRHKKRSGEIRWDAVRNGCKPARESL